MSNESECLWYVTSVIELILEVLSMLFPNNTSRLLNLYTTYCQSKNISPGDFSPALGIVNSRTRQELIQKYLADPANGVSLLEKDLKNELA